MREILFRGKRKYDGEWVYGDLRQFKGETYIESYEADGIAKRSYPVIPVSVGQFTGMTDKNGTKIFEGDIVEFEDLGEEGYEYKEGYEFTNRARVTLDNYRVELTDWLDKEGCLREEMCYDYDNFIDLLKHSEVIGNVHDNPELLKGGADNDNI